MWGAEESTAAKESVATAMVLAVEESVTVAVVAMIVVAGDCDSCLL